MDAQAPTKSVDQEDIFDVLGAGNIPEEEKGALLGQMLLLIQQRVFMRVMDTLPAEAVSMLETEAVENEETSQLEKIIEKYIPNYSDLYEEEARKVRQELIISAA